ncbi:MAG: hypothetical protein ACRDD7_10935 [Peptostreptococcaceae bacterium]
MEEVKIVNLKQVSLYIKNGLQPKRLEITDRLVFVFNAEEAKPLFEKWCNYTLT